MFLTDRGLAAFGAGEDASSNIGDGGVVAAFGECAIGPWRGAEPSLWAAASTTAGSGAVSPPLFGGDVPLRPTGTATITRRGDRDGDWEWEGVPPAPPAAAATVAEAVRIGSACTEALRVGVARCATCGAMGGGLPPTEEDREPYGDDPPCSGGGRVVGLLERWRTLGPPAGACTLWWCCSPRSALVGRLSFIPLGVGPRCTTALAPAAEEDSAAAA